MYIEMQISLCCDVIIALQARDIVEEYHSACRGEKRIIQQDVERGITGSMEERGTDVQEF